MKADHLKKFKRRSQPKSDERVTLRVMPWWWACIGAVAAVTLGAVSWLLVWSIAGKNATLQIEAIKVGLSVVAGVGGVSALLLAFRRQLHNEHVAQDTTYDAVQRRITELYAKAVEQLGHEAAAVRLGGLYALERLAHDNAEHRQTVVDVICAYLRMPLDWGASITSILQTDIRHQDVQVRITAQRLLQRHLADPEIHVDSSAYWDGMAIDLRGALLINLDFAHCRFRELDCSYATFNGETWFSESLFNGPNVTFKAARFEGKVFFAGDFRDEVNFDGAYFTHEVDFSDAEFRGGATFEAAHFEATADFERVVFRYVDFNAAQFSAAALFRGAHFGLWARFEDTLFNGGEPDLTKASADSKAKVIIWPSPWRALQSDDAEKLMLTRGSEVDLSQEPNDHVDSEGQERES